MRTFYSFAVFFSALAFIITTIHSLIYFKLGRPMYTMESFASWYFLGTIATLVISLIILKYYHYKKYKFAFITGVIAAISSLAFSLLVYGMMMGAKVVSYYIPVYIFSLAVGIIYGVSLVPSPAGKRPWLRTAGILVFVLHAFLMVVVIAFTRNTLSNVEVERIHQWTSLASLLIPGLFTLNFLSELRTTKLESVDPKMPPVLKSIMTFVAVVAFIAFIIIGAKFSFQSLGAIAWRSQEPERAGRLAEPFEARTFVGSNGETLLYTFMKPIDYDSTTQYPLVICLHHGGAHGNDNIRQIDGAPAAQLLATAENRKKYPAFLFVPQSPEGIGWGGIANLPAIDSLVFEGLAAFEKEFSIDEKRRYVTGSSGGGYGSWHFICTRPKMFAASIPICGGTDPKLAPKIVDVPVWVFHGEDDTAVPVRFSRDMVSAIKDAGGDPKYTEFAGTGHNIWGEVSATPGLMDWMFAQKRD